MNQQKKVSTIRKGGKKRHSSTLTENNPLEVWDDDWDGAVLP